jgi:hypothetical protein
MDTELLWQNTFTFRRGLNKRTGYVACTREKSDACWVLVGKSEGNRPLERRRYKSEDNINMDRREI